MQRTAFKMQLKPGFVEEYERRHDEIWPELVELLAQAGIRDYSIFFDQETHVLFAVHKLTDPNRVKELPDHELMQRWWRQMAELMETNPDLSPVVKPLRQVFHMD